MSSYYEILNEKYYKNENDRHNELEIILKQNISKLRYLCKSNEYDMHSTPIGYLIEYIKGQIIDIILYFVASDKQEKYKIKRWDDINWCKELFNDISHFRIPDVLFWVFLNVPYVYDSNEEIIKFRGFYNEMLDMIMTEWKDKNYFKEKEYLYMTQLNSQIYPLSYHNNTNKYILAKYCKLMRKICPFINYINPNLNNIKNELKNKLARIKLNDKSSKIKVCFISESFIKDTSVLRDRMGIILNLDRTIYDVYYATCNVILKGAPVALEFNDKMKDKYIKLDLMSLTKSREVLASYNFDIIVYPDIGMRPFQTALAYSRMAPVQINTWGHSDTCGIDTIDYYVSSKYFELENDLNEVQKHYTEEIILLDSFGTYYYNPCEQFIKNDYKFKDRSEFGFKASDNIYWCLQTFFKINYEFVDMLARIVENDSSAKILLSNVIGYSNSHINNIIARIGKDKIIVYPALDKTIYYNLLKISDVVVDPYPFGGCNSSIEAFTFGIPVVSLPSKFINGRFTYGFYKKMGLNECIVSSKAEYIKLAQELIKNVDKKNEISKMIKDKNHLLFKEEASIKNWNELLIDKCYKLY